MQEDKKMRSLLSTYGMQEPFEGFENKVMQLLKKPVEERAAIFINPLLLRMLAGVFVSAAIILLIIAFFLDPQMFVKVFPVSLPESIYTQVFSFLSAFWVVMFANMMWNKRKTSITN